MTHPASPADLVDLNAELRVALTIVEQMLRGWRVFGVELRTRDLGRAMARKLFRLGNAAVAEFLFESMTVPRASETEVLADDVVRALVRIAAVFTERDRFFATTDFQRGYLRHLVEESGREHGHSDDDGPRADWSLGMIVGWAAAAADVNVLDDARTWHRENPEEAAVGATRDWRDGKLEVGEVA